MKLLALSFSNFKRSVREYGMLILSLTFSIFVFFNFQSVIYSESMDVLENYNKEYIDIIVQAASVVFGVFLFFFIWYASNVFLNQRKKEIGIYIFMGLDNVRIGKMYMLESVFIGLLSLLAGIGTGVLFSKLFQMLLLKLSDISVDIKFSFSWEAILITAGMFLVIYGLMTLKSYHTLKTSSVLNLLSGAKQQEMQKEKWIITFLKIAGGVGILLFGYYLAWDTGDINSLGNALGAVVLVIVGVYLLFSGLIPAILRKLSGNKYYLYKKERTLWVNNLAFRMKKNYRTYAMVTVLMICSVTVMAISIAMKQRYEKITHFDQTYTYQVLSSEEKNGEEIAKGIEQENKIKFWNEMQVVMVEPSVVHSKYTYTAYGLVAFSDVKQAAKKAGLPFDYKELKDNQVIELSHEVLMDISGDAIENYEQKIGSETYDVIKSDNTPYFGALQNDTKIFILSDKTFESLKNLGGITYFYNYRIENMKNMEASRAYLNTLAQSSEDGQAFTGVNYTQIDGRQDNWIRVMYSLCIFMFVTLVLAAGSIIFLKVGNEVYEDKERYKILEKMGIQKKSLRKSVRNEICFTYYCPFVLMMITSYFSVKALGNVMREDLFMVNIWSMGIILLVFTVICATSVYTAKKKLSLIS